MPTLAAYAEVIMGNIWAANIMLGTSIPDELDKHIGQEHYIQLANDVAEELFKTYPKCKYFANTFRFMNNPKHNLFYATLHTKKGDYFSRTYETHEVVDRIGSGDAFMGGLIYAIKNNLEEQEIIETATQAGYDKLFIPGDFIY